MATYVKCGACGATRTEHDVVLVGENANSAHTCGFLAIRCTIHPHALQNAKRAVRRHLAGVAARAADRENRRA